MYKRKIVARSYKCCGRFTQLNLAHNQPED